MQIYTDPASGRSYTVDPATGESRWLEDAKLTDTQIIPVPHRGDLDDDPVWQVMADRDRPGTTGMKAAVVIVGLLIVVAAVGLLVEGLHRPDTSAARPGGSSSAPRATDGAPSPTPATRGIPGPGRAVRDGAFRFTVTGTRVTKRLGNDLVNTEADGRYLVVSLKVENVGDSEHVYLGLVQRLFDTQGRSYSPDAKGAAFTGDVRHNYATPIGSGDSIETTLVFDVPDGVTPDRIVLHDGPISGGVEVGLRD